MQITQQSSAILLLLAALLRCVRAVSVLLHRMSFEGRCNLPNTEQLQLTNAMILSIVCRPAAANGAADGGNVLAGILGGIIGVYALFVIL